MTRSFYSYLPLLFLACAHSSSSDPTALKAAAEMFHERIRWRDYRGAEEFIVPDRRAMFDSARQRLDDDHNLSITDYQLEDVRFSADRKRAWVVSRVSWMRLPSVSEKSVQIDSEFVWQNGTWLLARQSAGPFVEELGADYSLR